MNTIRTTEKGEIYVNDKLQKCYISPKGYLQFNYKKDESKITILYVHRLVALEHVPNPKNLPCVLHIDGDRLNNIPQNLKWVTHKEVIDEAIKRGNLKPKSKGDSYPIPKRVSRSKNGIVREFNSVREAARYHNVSPYAVTLACKGEIKLKSYNWSYM
jgi:hypothetical protein